jgi:uncharacterized protein
MRSALVIMARYPTAGQVKTRLARVIGTGAACALYRAFVRDLDARLSERAETVVWAFDPPDSDFASVIASAARCVAQVGSDLGERMFNCFLALCREGFDRVTMIGADCPHIRDAWLDEAARELSKADVVLGPSADGGYYLVAMRAPHDLFRGIPMSTAGVLQATLDRASQRGLKVHLLPQTFDIDEAADLTRLQALLADPALTRLLPHTAAALAQICSQ